MNRKETKELLKTIYNRISSDLDANAAGYDDYNGDYIYTDTAKELVKDILQEEYENLEFRRTDITTEDYFVLKSILNDLKEYHYYGKKPDLYNMIDELENLFMNMAHRDAD